MPQIITSTQDRLKLLRQQLEDLELDGFILPRTDEFQSEFLPACSEHLSWLTRFTGSAGIAIILQDRAVVMSDGRYTIQLAAQIDGALYDAANSVEVSAGDWLRQHAKDGAKVGYDPWLFTKKQFQKLQDDLEGKDIELVALEQNPVDVIWEGRPEFPKGEVLHFPDKLAGKTAQEKIEQITGLMKKKGADCLLITAPDSVSWLLNVRGEDVPFTPLVLSYAFLHSDGKLEWFVGRDKAASCSFEADIVVCDKDDITDRLAGLGSGKIWVDEAAISVKLLSILNDSEAEVVYAKDPCVLEKAQKTTAEQEAMRQAHIRDGAALVKFLKWLEEEGGSGNETELSVEVKLEEFRAEDPAYKGASFSTIAGYGANGAIVHYRANEDTSKTIEEGSLLLVDSGGQYFCDEYAGTTDITRTIAIGKPTEEMKRHYTLVLKGHIAVSMAKFPQGTTGAQIDALARAALWQEGLDFAHGTGHGVGCYLGVHEEAATISPRGNVSFEVGMIISNEPGYYKKDAYGIRIENLILVKDAGTCEATGKPMLGFETITYAPYQKALIDYDLLSKEERLWIRQYSEKVANVLSDYLNKKELFWLDSQIEQ